MRSTPDRKRARPAASAAPSGPHAGAATRDRLLRAAATAVAERGFAGTTVREICRRARANVAAVNYHFRSKAELQAETIRYVLSQMRPPEIPLADVSSDVSRDASPDASRAARSDAFRDAVHALARHILGAREPWQTRFIVRAVLESPEGAEVAVREFMEPRIRALEAAIRPLRPTASPRELRLHALSVVGQLVYHRLAAPVALRLLGERAWTETLTDEVASHVAAFSDRALAYAPCEPETPRPPRGGARR